MAVAYLHLMTGHLDAVKYRPELTVEKTDYIYFAIAYLSWAFISTVLYYLLRRFYGIGVLKLSILLSILMLCVYLPLFFIFDHAVYSMVYGTEQKGVFELLGELSNGLVFLYSILGIFCLAICLSIVSYQSNKYLQLLQLKTEKKVAENALALSQQRLKILQSQLSPHFLFNCLSAISALARKHDEEDLIRSISSVASLLRYATKASQQTEVLLEEELGFTQDYLNLQSLRFCERFNARLDIQLQTEHLLVIPLCLQPLVENVFHHGVAHSIEIVDINVSVLEKDQQLIIVVSNTRHIALKAPFSQGLGNSLYNLRKRLDIAYADTYSYSIDESEERYSVRIELPIRQVGKNDK